MGKTMHIHTYELHLAKTELLVFPATPTLQERLAFFRESRGMGNKIATNHVIGTGEEKIESGVGGTGNSNDTQLYTQIYLLYK